MNDRFDRFLALTQGAFQSRRELAWLYETHLVPARPTRIIEIGVAAGGTTRLFLDLVGPDGAVVGVDLVADALAADVRDHPNFRLVLGSSSHPTVLGRVQAHMPVCDLLLIDGDHSERGVLADTDAYLPLVRPGGLVLWHDVQLESPCGIKRTWYRTLKPRLPGASEYFADPFNTGFGIWHKPAGGTGAPAGNFVGSGDHVSQVPPPPADAGAEAWTARAETLVADPSALREEVIAALLAAVIATTKTGAGRQRTHVVHHLAPQVLASLSRLQKWADVPRFANQMLALVPEFAPDGLRGLDEGLKRAQHHGAADAVLVAAYAAAADRCRQLGASLDLREP